MNRWLLAIALLGLVCVPAWAHRLDEYLQATIFSIEPGSVDATLRLVPGVAVAPAVIATIDSNHDGVISSEEQHRYAKAVLADLELEEDGRKLPLHLTSASFPQSDLMKEGTGEIELSFSADRPTAAGEHRLRFKNGHLSDISVYLVNSLVPQNKDLQLGAQSRSRDQSLYELTVTDASGAPLRSPSRSGFWGGFGATFRLGARHIAEGTDHLLFFLTLLLPAPLLARAGRWSGRASIRRSLTHILGIVTAFTLGHSFTLALSGLGLVHLPSRPVEVMIALSILVSAVHALRPLFPGREAVVAGSFGLVHGLAFASALNELGVTGWYRLVSLFGFNLGIEAMQLTVVAFTLPALLLLSRTKYYAVFRIVGAAFAVVASCAWISERVLDRPNAMGYGVEKLVHHGVALCAGLWVCAAVAWLSQPRWSVLSNRLASICRFVDR